MFALETNCVQSGHIQKHQDHLLDLNKTPQQYDYSRFEDSSNKSDATKGHSDVCSRENDFKKNKK